MGSVAAGLCYRGPSEQKGSLASGDKQHARMWLKSMIMSKGIRLALGISKILHACVCYLNIPSNGAFSQPWDELKQFSCELVPKDCHGALAWES